METRHPPGGVRIRHRTVRSGLILIPLLWIPYTGQSLDICNVCAVIHPVKTVHLWLDDTGAAVVSWGVYRLLQRAGLGLFDLVAVSTIDRPPPLRLSPRRTQRAAVDAANRAQVIWRSP